MSIFRKANPVPNVTNLGLSRACVLVYDCFAPTHPFLKRPITRKSRDPTSRNPPPGKLTILLSYTEMKT
jgi:hypothetical protein